MYSENHDDCQKFYAIDKEKQTRIINAAMKEFLSGFKNASTDNIVREAGISKGLLFHYFGTKENLYDFLIDYAIDTMRAEFLDLINLGEKDIFDSIWQMALLKRDVSLRFPVMFEFITTAYIDSKNCPAKEHLKKFNELSERRLAKVYESCDRSLFRDDIDPQVAVKIVYYAIQGWAESKAAGVEFGNIRADIMENYDFYLEEMQRYMEVMRKCFYKEA